MVATFLPERKPMMPPPSIDDSALTFRSRKRLLDASSSET